jgi:hypothetical protein
MRPTRPRATIRGSADRCLIATVVGMERAFGLEIPHTLEEACDPRRLALVVYDMQIGVLGQIKMRMRSPGRSWKCSMPPARPVYG